jgi:soluble lytic murein transglycosylase
MEKLLANRDTVSAGRLLPLTSAAKQPLFGTRLALLTKAPDAAERLGALGPAASTDAGVLMDRARWLRDSGQSLAARALMANPRQLTAPPAEPEKWLELLLVLARGASADRNHAQAFQIASQLGDAYPPGTDITDRPVQERDDYTSLAWLAGTLALNQLGRPADAATAFARYSRGGQSTQVLTKGLYWAGRAAQQAGQGVNAMRYFEEAAAFPELFYGQLSHERLGRPVPAPTVPFIRPSASDRAAFERKEVVQASRLLGQLGSWEDQSLFIRNLAETADDPIERTLTSDLALQIGRPTSASGRRAARAMAARPSTRGAAIPKCGSRRRRATSGRSPTASSVRKARSTAPPSAMPAPAA